MGYCSSGTPHRVLQSSGPSWGTAGLGTLIGYCRARDPHRVLQGSGTPHRVLQGSGTPHRVLQLGDPSSGTAELGDPHRVLQSSGTLIGYCSLGAPHRVLLPFHGAEQELVEDTAHREDRPQLKRYFKRVLTSVSKITVKTARSIHL